MTVRRDLVVLHREGLLEKVHGGALAVPEPSTTEPGFEANSARRLTEKELIGAHAASLVKPGSAIAISAGTTTHAFARHLVDIPRLTVVTNSVWVADVLHRSGNDSLSVLLTGGLRTPPTPSWVRSRSLPSSRYTSTPSSWVFTGWTVGPASAPPTCSRPRPTG